MSYPPHTFEPKDDDPARCGAYVRAGMRCEFPEGNRGVHAPGALPSRPLTIVPTASRVDDNDRVFVAMDAPQASVEAAGVARRNRGQVRTDVLSLALHPQGITDYEAGRTLGQPHQTVSSARNSLMQDGYVVPLTDAVGGVVKRPTARSTATVWVATPLGRAELAARRQVSA